jgi:hypothetical protein
MKLLISIFFLTILFNGVSAQQQNPADSVYLFTQTLRKINDAQQNAASLINSDAQNISVVSLKYTLQKGHFRTAQTAESAHGISMQSSGIKSLGKFKVTGYFNFERSWQDSLSWTLQGIPDQATPYYFAAGKAGKYERLNYNFGGLLTYGLIKDKLYLAAGAAYYYNTASRSVDPRPSVQTFAFNINPQILYRIAHHVIGGEFILGYGKEDNVVSYRNAQYAAQSLDYADRINYLVMGYGTKIPFGAGQLKRSSQTSGFGLNYAFKDDHAYLNASLKYNKEVQDNLDGKDFSTANIKYGTFILNNYSVSVLSGLKTALYQHQLHFMMQWQNGYDHNYYELKGLSSYKYSHQRAAVYYTALKNSSSWRKAELGLNVIYDKIDKKDLASSISSVFGYIQPGLNGTFYNSFKDKSKLSLTLAPGLRLPVGNQINVPVTDNVLANHIIYPDYTYWTSTAGIMDFNVKYISSHLFKNVSSGISLNAVYISSLAGGTNYKVSDFTPSKNRLDFTLGFNLYF